MNICEIKTADIANGSGMRVSLFVSGCTNHCKGCFQPETWDFNYGIKWTKEHENRIINELSKKHYRGLTLLGGDPFEFVNQRGLIEFLRRVKRELPDKDIWCYTGFLSDVDLIPGGKRYCDVTDEMLSLIDVLVDGPFVETLKNLRLPYCGSENQRVIDMNKTRELGRIILY